MTNAPRCTAFYLFEVFELLRVWVRRVAGQMQKRSGWDIFVSYRVLDRVPRSYLVSVRADCAKYECKHYCTRDAANIPLALGR